MRNLILKKLLLVTYILLLSTVVFSQETDQNKASWILVGSSKDGDKYYINSEIIKKDEDGIKIWTKINYKSLIVKKVKYQNVEAKQLIVVNCEEKQLKLVRILVYSSSGKPIKDVINEDYERKWQDAIPGSNGALFIKYTCQKFY